MKKYLKTLAMHINVQIHKKFCALGKRKILQIFVSQDLKQGCPNYIFNKCQKFQKKNLSDVYLDALDTFDQ